MSYVETLGKMNKVIILLLDLKTEIMEDIVFIMKAKSHIRNAFQKRNF